MAERESTRHKKARHLLAKTGHAKFGGHFTDHEDDTRDKAIADHEVRKAMAQHDRQEHGPHGHTRLKLARGGNCEGFASGGRLDRAPRGGHRGGHKGGTKVNINVMPHPPMGGLPIAPPPGGGLGPPGGMPPPRPPMPMPPPPGGPPMGGAPPMGPGGPMIHPMGGPPGGMPPPMMHKHGGKVGPGRVHMTAGAGGGEGRLEKSRAAMRNR